jgi:hypothetical protein
MPTEEPTATPTEIPTYLYSNIPTTLKQTKRPSKTPSIRPTKATYAPTPTTTKNPLTISNLSSASPTKLYDLLYAPDRRVMTGTPNIYNIYYGNFSSPYEQKFTSLIDYFAQNLGNSSWWNMNTVYYQIIGGVKTHCSNSLRWVKSINLRSNYISEAVTESDIQNDLQDAIDNGLLPLDENGIYSVMFAGSLSVTANGQKWGSWRGYHNSFWYRNTGKLLKYQLVGDPSTSTVVGSKLFPDDESSPNGHNGADTAVSSYAHGATEVVTNYDGAWLRGPQYENADVCNGVFGPALDEENNSNSHVGEKKFLIQANWVPTKDCCLRLDSCQPWPNIDYVNIKFY